MELSIDHLGAILAAVFTASTKWYNISLILKVAVATLERIGSQIDPADRLREMLKAWLETAAKPTWRDIVNALRDVTVGHSKLASDIETKYCTTAKTGQTIPEVQQLIPTNTEVLTLQQECQELRMKDQQLQDSQRRIHTLQQELHTKDQQLQDSQRRVHTLQQELQTKDQQLQDSQRHMHTQQQELQGSQRQIKELTHQVEEKQHTIDEREIQCEQTIGELRAVVARQRQELQQAVKDKQAGQRQLHELKQQLLTMKQPVAEPQPPIVQPKKIRDIKWQKESNAPEKMYRGSAASDCNMAYFSGDDSTRVHSYNYDTREWCQLPDTPHIYSTLVVVHHMLTMVGGELRLGEATDSLLSLMGEGRDRKWLPYLPAMPTKRYLSAVICSGHSLIVAGGNNGHNILATVEVLDTRTRQWSIASSLTHPFSDATVSISCEKLYMLGGCDQTGSRTHCVLSCSVPELLQPQPLAGKLRITPANQSTIWWCVANAPHSSSSCATLCGQLVAVGGEEAGKSTRAITGYNERTDSWEAMGGMSTARKMALVANLNGKIMVVGGRVGGWLDSLVAIGEWVVGDLGWTRTDEVEILC